MKSVYCSALKKERKEEEGGGGWRNKEFWPKYLPPELKNKKEVFLLSSFLKNIFINVRSWPPVTKSN